MFGTRLNSAPILAVALRRFLELIPFCWALSAMLAACGGGPSPTPPPLAPLDGLYYTAGINANSGGISSTIVKASFVAGSNTADYEQILSDTSAVSYPHGTLTYTVDSNGLMISTAGGETTDGRLSGDGNTVLSARINSTEVHNINFGVKGATSGLSNASLSGVYCMTSFNVLSASGVSTVNTTMTFDGAGNATYSQIYSNETVADQTRNGSYTYNVTADGHITFAESGVVVTDGRLSADSNTFVAAIINSTSSHNLTFGMKVGDSGFTNASLSGTYYFAAFGGKKNEGYSSLLGKLTFDGAGNFAGDEIYSAGSAVGQTRTLSGTYSVNADGSFTMGSGVAGAWRLSQDAKSFTYSPQNDAGFHIIYVGVKRQ